MNKNLRKAVIAGNWKMNKNRAEAKALIEELKPLVQDAGILKNILHDGIWTRYHEARSLQEQKENKKGEAPQ